MLEKSYLPQRADRRRGERNHFCAQGEGFLLFYAGFSQPPDHGQGGSYMYATRGVPQGIQIDLVLDT
jgi:hypothetical protein